MDVVVGMRFGARGANAAQRCTRQEDKRAKRYMMMKRRTRKCCVKMDLYQQ